MRRKVSAILCERMVRGDHLPAPRPPHPPWGHAGWVSNVRPSPTFSLIFSPENFRSHPFSVISMCNRRRKLEFRESAAASHGSNWSGPMGLTPGELTRRRQSDPKLPFGAHETRPPQTHRDIQCTASFASMRCRDAWRRRVAERLELRCARAYYPLKSGADLAIGVLVTEISTPAIRSSAIRQHNPSKW